jgi:hypothetical protein
MQLVSSKGKNTSKHTATYHQQTVSLPRATRFKAHDRKSSKRGVHGSIPA